MPPHLQHLYAHLRHSDYLEQIEGFNEEYLHIYSHDVLEKIRRRDASWETMVPSGVGALIKERALFGYGG